MKGGGVEQRDGKNWWERVRGKNRTLKGYISARRRFTARAERLAGRQPQKRQYSVPEIARRIGSPLTALKRVIRGDDEPPPNLLVKLAKDLEMPLSELREALGPAEESLEFTGDAADALKALEEGLVTSARAFVQLLRNVARQPAKR
jgi:transcriptional regulator with XRE-family HTH domain